MQHHKLNFLICQDSWLMPFIIQSHPSERQECFLHGCVWEGNLFPLSCSTGGGTDGGGQGVPAPGALQEDASLARSLTRDTCVTLVWHLCDTAAFCTGSPHSCCRLSGCWGPAVRVPTVQTKALCGSGALRQQGSTEEPTALLRSGTLRSPYKRGHDCSH